MEAGRRLAVGLMAAAITVASTGIAVAGVSDGSYRPAKQHCSGHADDSNNPTHVEPGCASLIGSVSDGNGNELGSAGVQQTADGTNASDPIVNTTPSPAFNALTGVRLYFGADDNLDSGEHDSSSKIGDGPSDGGAVTFNVDPASIQSWIDALRSGDMGYVLAHPLPLVDAGAGSCADGICASGQTRQRVAYQGGDPSQHRDVADYTGREWDPETCAGPSDSAADCGRPGGISYWHDHSGTAYVEPGLQVYEDPNPEASPIGPYPLPALYVGPCGVIAGGGQVRFLPTPLTNAAGQLSILTGC